MAKNTTESLYQTTVDNVAALLTAVKAEGKSNKRLANSVARLERLAKTLPTFQAKYVKIVSAKEEPEAEADTKPAKVAKKKKAAKPAKKAAKKAVKKAAKKKPEPDTDIDSDADDGAPEEATLN